MKDFIAIVVTIIVTNRITEQVYEKMNFHYNGFEDRFSLNSLLIDFGLYFIIATPIYMIIRMFISKGHSLLNNRGTG
ncbi:hypothetical protein Q9251_01670 [Alkalihalobacillus macyae]|uniref:hypothetical protein n=1 Tax=Guptibacillus hwajinpoensis TaxID=208199 RepID=UPI00273B8EA1|nr:hypothetical protein [Alkalihalobacillus macyae]MDP4549586.1 hypothetical protein [Alkalihalobacillus macyae]